MIDAALRLSRPRSNESSHVPSQPSEFRYGVDSEQLGRITTVIGHVSRNTGPESAHLIPHLGH
jgi:hypothetical protein